MILYCLWLILFLTTLWLPVSLKPRATVIGSAWRESVQRVYIKGSETNSTPLKPAPYVSTEPPAPIPEPIMPPTSYNSQSPEQMNVIEPSPEEMRQFLLDLEDILNSDDDDDSDDDYDNDGLLF